jgi:allophanate hydrolase
MSVFVIKPGVQSTIQSRPRTGMHHLGVPSGGAADPLSLALANRLVGNPWDAPAIEAALVGPIVRFDAATAFAVVGGDVSLLLNGVAASDHEVIAVEAGDELVVGPVGNGARVYLAVPGGFAAGEMLGSASTNLQAGFGGYEGRALQSGDRLALDGGDCPPLATPAEFRPTMPHAWCLRTCSAAETTMLDAGSFSALFESNWTIAQRADRMGLRLEGPRLSVSTDGRMPSAGVMPGTVQCPEDGAPYVLSVDAGTVGGYPRVAQVARADRHILGQLKPGDHVRLLHREHDAAVAELRVKLDYWRAWLPEIDDVLC